MHLFVLCNTYIFTYDRIDSFTQVGIYALGVKLDSGDNANPRDKSSTLANYESYAETQKLLQDLFMKLTEPNPANKTNRYGVGDATQMSHYRTFALK